METPILRRLRDLPDLEVADNNPDVRGWTVRGNDGQALGVVFELIVEPKAMKVRYLDVELDARFHINEYENHILLPIGVAALDTDDDNIFVPMLNTESVLSYPHYVEIEITREYEEAMLHALGIVPATTAPRFYEQKSYDADSFYSSRNSS